MRVIFSIVSLLIVLAIVGMLAKKQLGGSVAADPRHSPATQATGVSLPVTSPGATPQAQSLQLQQEVQKKIEASMQARPMPEDDKP